VVVVKLAGRMTVTADVVSMNAVVVVVIVVVVT
jgi:hypothetical protein